MGKLDDVCLDSSQEKDDSRKRKNPPHSSLDKFDISGLVRLATEKLGTTNQR